MPKTPPQPPVFVFAHGFLGFVDLGPVLPFIRYFRGVRGMIAAIGYPSIFPRVPSAAGVEERAAALAREMFRERAAKFVVIGHSMGGLDARFAAARLDPDHRISAVVSIGTPHWGSPIARAILDGDDPMSGLLRRLWRNGLADLAPAACRRLNAEIPDRGDVRYISFAAQTAIGNLVPPLRPFARIIDAEEGANDGMVSVKSAAWGETRDVLTGDHFELVGWSLPKPLSKFRRFMGPEPQIDHLGLYQGIAREFAD